MTHSVVQVVQVPRSTQQPAAQPAAQQPAAAASGGSSSSSSSSSSTRTAGRRPQTADRRRPTGPTGTAPPSAATGLPTRRPQSGSWRGGSAGCASLGARQAAAPRRPQAHEPSEQAREKETDTHRRPLSRRRASWSVGRPPGQARCRLVLAGRLSASRRRHFNSRRATTTTAAAVAADARRAWQLRPHHGPRVEPARLSAAPPLRARRRRRRPRCRWRGGPRRLAPRQIGTALMKLARCLRPRPAWPLRSGASGQSPPVPSAQCPVPCAPARKCPARAPRPTTHSPLPTTRRLPSQQQQPAAASSAGPAPQRPRERWECRDARRRAAAILSASCDSSPAD